MKHYVFLLIVCIFFVMISCAPEQFVYLNDMKPEKMYLGSDNMEMVIQSGDRLRIFVSSENSELTIPFNQETDMQSKVGGGDMPGGKLANQGRDYQVDLDGNIMFPILGTLYTAGLTCKELSLLIKEQLKERNLLDGAVVMVDILNWKITVLGEVGRVGVVEVAEGHYITLLEALSRAGGLTEYAAGDKVSVIREKDGIRKMYVNDLGSMELFNSPVYYLQQNDIVYVQPKEAKSTAKEERKWRWYSTGLSALSLLISIITLTRL